MFPYLEKFLQVVGKRRSPNDEMDLLVAALACEVSGMVGYKDQKDKSSMVTMGFVTNVQVSPREAPGPLALR